MDKKTIIRTALRIAAEEAYQRDVVDTGMVDLVVGPGNDFSDREDWIEQKMDEWHDAADKIIRVPHLESLITNRQGIARLTRPPEPGTIKAWVNGHPVHAVFLFPSSVSLAPNVEAIIFYEEEMGVE